MGARSSPVPVLRRAPAEGGSGPAFLLAFVLFAVVRGLVFFGSARTVGLAAQTSGGSSPVTTTTQVSGRWLPGAQAPRLASAVPRVSSVIVRPTPLAGSATGGVMP